MSSDPISRGEIESRDKLYDERFARDKERIEKTEELTAKMSELLSQVTEIQKSDHEELKEHNKRISTLETRPSAWMDKIWSAGIASAVSAIVAFLVK